MIGDRDKSNSVVIREVITVIQSMCGLKWGLFLIRIGNGIDIIADTRSDNEYVEGMIKIEEYIDNKDYFYYQYQHSFDVLFYAIYKKNNLKYTDEIISNISFMTDLVFYIANYNQQFIIKCNRIKESHQTEKLQSLGMLTSIVTHDLNNILAALYGNIEILKIIPNMPQEALEYIEKIQKTSTMASGLTRKILNFTKLEIKENNFDVINAINTAVDTFKSLIPKTISVRFNNNVPYLELYGRKTDIENIIINICTNARDAITDTGIIEITTSIIELDEVDKSFLNYDSFISGKYFMVLIEDSGYGINDDVKSKIFDEFFTTKPVNKGTGLGLYNVYTTICDYNGLIKVNSIISQGTKFYLYFPINENNNMIKPIEIVEEIGKNIIDMDRSLYTIMIIDDEIIVSEVIDSFLTRNGFKTVVFNNPLDAIKYYKNNYNLIDLIILDMIMPLISGEKAYYQLKKINNNLKVMGLSGYCKDDTIMSLLDNGMIKFLQKPVEPKDLIDSVINILNLKDVSILNEESGINSLYNCENAYYKLLSRYLEYYGDLSEIIINAFIKDDYNTIREYIHKIRGISKNLGSDELYLLTSTIDEQIRIDNSTKNCEKEIYRFIILNNNIIKEIRKKKNEKI